MPRSSTGQPLPGITVGLEEAVRHSRRRCNPQSMLRPLVANLNEDSVENLIKQNRPRMWRSQDVSGRIRIPLAALGAFAMLVSLSAQAPSAALTAKECSAKYKTAKTAGTLAGQTWSEFRKKGCAGAEPATAARLQRKKKKKKFFFFFLARCFPKVSESNVCQNVLRARPGFIRALISTTPTRPLTATAVEMDSKGWWLLQYLLEGTKKLKSKGARIRSKHNERVLQSQA